MARYPRYVSASDSHDKLPSVQPTAVPASAPRGRAAAAPHATVLSVCVLATPETARSLPRVLAGLLEQSVADGVEIVVADTSGTGRQDLAALETDAVPFMHIDLAGLSDAAAWNAAWRAAAGRTVAFLRADVVPGPLWCEALLRIAARGRPVALSTWVPDPDSVRAGGILSRPVWTSYYDRPLAQVSGLACLRADLDVVGGLDEGRSPTAPFAAEVLAADLVLRLVDAGADLVHARHGLLFHPIGARPPMVRGRWAQARAIAAELTAHPRARARVLAGGIAWHRRDLEIAGGLMGVCLAPGDPRWLLLGAAWLHERTHLNPRAGGARRRWTILPAVLVDDVVGAVVTTAATWWPEAR
jgi:hypothetical protein